MAEPFSSQNDVAARVFAALEAVVANEPAIKGCAYEHAPTDAQSLPCITMRTLEGAPIEKRYLDGGSVANYRFAVLLRQQAHDDQTRLEAQAALTRIALSLAQASIDLGAARAPRRLFLDTLPHGVKEAEGYADWQAECTLQYQES